MWEPSCSCGRTNSQTDRHKHYEINSPFSNFANAPYRMSRWTDLSLFWASHPKHNDIFHISPISVVPLQFLSPLLFSLTALWFASSLSPQLALHSFIPLSSSLYPLHHRCIVTSLNAKRTKAVWPQIRLRADWQIFLWFVFQMNRVATTAQITRWHS